jgi:hypothetical protein
VVPGKSPQELHAALVIELTQRRAAEIVANDSEALFLAWTEPGTGFSPLCQECITESLVKRRMQQSMVEQPKASGVEYEFDKAIMHPAFAIDGLVHATALIEGTRNESLVYIRSAYRSLHSGALYFSNGSYERNLISAVLRQSDSEP